MYVERNSVLRYDRVLFIIAVDIADIVGIVVLMKEVNECMKEVLAKHCYI